METFITKNSSELKLVTPDSNKFDILVIGVVHGDEPQGRDFINNYLKFKRNSKLGFIPVLNPDGLRFNTRTNANKVDLNRNFPTSNWVKSEKNNYWGGETPGSEIETKFLIKVILEYLPKLILTIHAPYKVVNYDGNAMKYAAEISKIIGYPVCNDIGYPTPGSLGTYAGIERGIPTITLEIDEETPLDKLQPKIFNIFNYLETLSL